MTFFRSGLLYSMLLLLCTTGLQAQNWNLVWSDEFENDSLDESKWSYQYGTGTSEGLTGWGNNELQYYTDREENIYIEDNMLHIVARVEIYSGMHFTSARIRTIEKGDWKYGRFEFRVRLPEGRGIWPAIWMMPTESVYGGWAASGEIDIMEMVGHQPATVHGTLHYGGSWPDNVHSGNSYQLDSGKFSDDFHIFALEWEEGEIRWYVDGNLYQTQTNWNTAGHPFPAPFDEKFHLLMNVAVGGNWPGNPDHTTEFPQTMIIDYVRVYQDQETTSSEEGVHEVPDQLGLHQNFPNPFNPVTQIEFELPEQSDISLRVFDVTGRQMTTLAEGSHQAGIHQVEFDAINLSSGVYIYQLQAGNQLLTRRMTVVK